MEEVVLIFKEGSDFDICLMLLSNYPYLRVPQVGDIVPLVATTTMTTRNRYGAINKLPVTYLDGVYEVVKVWAGNGQQLHPTPGFTVYQINTELQGYGIRVRKRNLPEYNGIPKSRAVLIEGTWPPVMLR